jgi:F0F1-type ATP synthase membrane subunit c/vacuolar-type H+-ATPase subunit K
MKRLLLWFLLLTASLLIVPSAFADEYGIGMPVNIGHGIIPDGSIVSATRDGYSLSTTDYDPNMVGVISLKPAIAFITTKVPNNKSMITSGNAQLRVSNTNGVIKAGDLLTSSKIKGVAQKADKSGYVIGTALQNYTGNNVGTILATINPRFAVLESNAASNLFANLKLAASSPFLTPLTSLRYILAVLVTTLSFVFGFLYFGRIAKTGVEALGRNPLASRSIQMSVFLNVSMSIGIMLFGVALAYIILIL